MPTRPDVRLPTRPSGWLLPAGAMFLSAAALLAGCSGGGGSTPAVEPALTLTVPSPIALEADRTVVFNVALAGAQFTEKTVTYSTSDLASTLATRAVAGYARGGSACGTGIDYVAVSGATLRIPAGATSATIAVTTCDDTVFQANKRFRLTISGATNTPVAVATIVNDDAGGLNDSGIDNCVNASGVSAACPVASLTGQDAETGRDALSVTQSAADGDVGFSFAKIGAGGEPLAAGAGSWSCVRDKVTGLLWQKETGVTQPTAITFADFQAAAISANTAGLCGSSAWRIPEVAEIAGLVHAGKTTGVAIDSTYFADTSGLGNQATSIYWSNNTYPTDANTDWAVDFSIGVIGVRNKVGSTAAGRLVSGTAPTASSAAPCIAGGATAVSDRFTANGDGTVTDKNTQLMWAQCSVGQSGGACGTGGASTASWSGAFAQVASANAAVLMGYTDWRLPNRNELTSLVERACRSPAINSTYFPGTVTASYWSSSPSVTSGASAWYVDFVDGDLGPGDTSGNRRLRLVRAGQ